MRASMNVRRALLLLAAGLLVSPGVGCHGGQPQGGPAAAPVVPVSRPVKRMVTDYVDYTGQTSSMRRTRSSTAGSRRAPSRRTACASWSG
jgi:hypothetical protein